MAYVDKDDSRPPLYEETTAGQMERGDSSEDDDEEQKEPPPEPTRFGWVQGVMVGRVLSVFVERPICVLLVFNTNIYKSRNFQLGQIKIKSTKYKMRFIGVQ